MTVVESGEEGTCLIKALNLLNFTISSVTHFAHAGELNDSVGSELSTHSAWGVTCKSIMRLRADFTVVYGDL